MTILTKYNNGNTIVTIMDDGTKIREYDSDPKPVHPESMDVKISNWCDGDNGKLCKWCHENSSPNGKHADLNKLMNILGELPAGVELALGGGDTFSHPNLYSFLIDLKKHGFIVNATVNAIHLSRHREDIIKYLDENLIKGLGISITNTSTGSDLEAILNVSDNVVFHVVMGINTPGMIDLLHSYCRIIEKDCKVLVLGYKQFRSGQIFYEKNPGIEENKMKWYREIRRYFDKPGLVISFDNLAIEQLNLKRFFTDKAWDKFYLGSDGEFTMYIDAVNECYARSSTSIERKSFNEYSILNFFGGLK